MSITFSPLEKSLEKKALIDAFIDQGFLLVAVD